MSGRAPGDDAAGRDLDRLDSWHADWSGLRAVVLGLGETGFAVADTLTELGGELLVVTGRSDPDRQGILDVLGVPVLVEPDPAAVPPEVLDPRPDVAVVSPGYHPDHPIILALQAAGVPIWGDIELAWRLRDKVRPADWLSVTGTNGKTTTTRLAAHLASAAGLATAAVGNVGVSVLDAIRDPTGFDVLVVELSSYQLHWLPTTGPGAPHPIAGVCLNLSEDHLDWHGGLEGYRAAKAKVYANAQVAAVYNRADAATIRMVEEAEVEEGCRAIGIDLGSPGPSELGVVDGVVIDRAFLEDRHHRALELTTLAELAAHGIDSPHLVVDVLAAAALVRALGVSPETVHDALPGFRLDPHRTEVVAAGEIAWIDDSKATNPHAADAALASRRSVVWILGGLLKGVDIAPLVAKHAARLRAAIVIGQERQAVLDALARHAPGVRVLEVVPGEDGGVMPEAVRLAVGVAQPGDTVLLSPAAASMDQFKDYADRGDRFAAAVRARLGGGPDDDDAAAAGHPA